MKQNLNEVITCSHPPIASTQSALLTAVIAMRTRFLRMHLLLPVICQEKANANSPPQQFFCEPSNLFIPGA